MLQLRNRTPFAAGMTVLPDPAGMETVFVAVKASFAMTPSTRVAEQQAPLTIADEFWGDPETTSLRYATEMHLAKPGTDVVLVGHAWPAAGRRAEHLDVRLAVGKAESTVRVFGDRTWRGGMVSASITPPQPFESMPLRYERAFGGVERDAGGTVVAFEERNPVGVGFRSQNDKTSVDGRPLPNLEDPRALVRGPRDRPPPAGFGFVAPAWAPRKSYAGTYDAAWTTSRAPFLPADFDSRFFHAAHPGLAIGTPLEGGEPIAAENVSRAGRLRVRIPRCRLGIRAGIGRTIEEPAPRIETVLIEPDEDRLSVLWRASVPCPRGAVTVGDVHVELLGMELERAPK